MKVIRGIIWGLQFQSVTTATEYRKKHLTKVFDHFYNYANRAGNEIGVVAELRHYKSTWRRVESGDEGR